jgi:hypothetical protein
MKLTIDGVKVNVWQNVMFQSAIFGHFSFQSKLIDFFITYVQKSPSPSSQANQLQNKDAAKNQNVRLNFNHFLKSK